MDNVVLSNTDGYEEAVKVLMNEHGMSELEASNLLSKMTPRPSVEEVSNALKELSKACLQEPPRRTVSPRRLTPIRYRESRIGRNDMCPCKSGKKFKNCCRR